MTLLSQMVSISNYTFMDYEGAKPPHIFIYNYYN